MHATSCFRAGSRWCDALTNASIRAPVAASKALRPTLFVPSHWLPHEFVSTLRSPPLMKAGKRCGRLDSGLMRWAVGTQGITMVGHGKPCHWR